MMSPLPSVIRGNLAASSDQVLHRPPSFEKYFKSSRNIQHKSLQIEQRFSHYEQKMLSAPIERCNMKIPRRLQTRKLARPLRRPNIDNERIEWNGRLAAWLHGNSSSTVEYIKISDQFVLTEKQLYYCSACHEFFHLNLKEREVRKVGCPRFRVHHVTHVKPVPIKKVKRSPNKQPRVVAKDPFSDRGNLHIPSLNPPKPFKRPVIKVVVDVPRLPSITKTAVTSQNTSLPAHPSRNSSTKNIASPAESSEIETPIEMVKESLIESPLKLPDIFQTPSTCLDEEDDHLDDEYEEDEEVVIADEKKTNVTPEEDDNTFEEKNSPELEAVTINTIDDSDVIVDCESVPGVDLFDELASNAASVCCEVDSVENDVISVGFNFDEDDAASSYSDLQHEEDYIKDDVDIEFELYLSDATSPIPDNSSPSPELSFRPRPPPPNLPTVRLEDSPDLPKIIKKKPQLAKRKAMNLLPTKQDFKPKPKENKFKRMSKEELAKRMQRAKNINGYRRKYEIDTDESYDVTTTDDEDDTSQITVYDDSFLEKYCLVSSQHLEFCKRRFNKLDTDKDGYLTSEQVVEGIRKMFSSKTLDDIDMCYIFRILETTSFDIFADKMNLKLFAIVTALAQKISQLDKHMKHLVGRVNIEVVDWKLCQARQLFEETMRKDATGIYKMPMESLWLELHAGGVSEEHEKQARRRLGHMKEMDLLDFVTYLPLFLLVHSNVVENPLNQERHI